MEKKRVYIETYGCQMNEADSEIVLSLMDQNNFRSTDKPDNADLILINTCSVRDNAEHRVQQRLYTLKKYKRENPGVLIGVLGCMAERLRAELIENNDLVDIVVGPDEYRKLPRLVEEAAAGQKGIAVMLSRVENYDDIVPLRADGVSAWISVMRGCDKFCSYCVVPFTRGRERSRSLRNIIDETGRLSRQGYNEVTLLGQNVNSYADGGNDFAVLIEQVSHVDRSMRIRFTTSHPYDFSDSLIDAIVRNKNICRHIHLPMQSGSDRILSLMERSYTAGHFLLLIKKIYAALPDVSISTDIIAGFPTETEDDHQATLEVMKKSEFDGAFMFKYSPREHTKAWRLGDDVPEQTKARRLAEIIDLQQELSLKKNNALIGKTVSVLIERESTKSAAEWMGRTGTNKSVIIPKQVFTVGETLDVTIERCTAATLFGSPVPRIPYRNAVNG